MTERNETAQPAPLGQVERGVGPLFPTRGFFDPHEKQARTTRRGTAYEVVKWTCQKCGKERSTLYIDDEWCHGDSVCISFVPGPSGTEQPNIPDEKCGDCWRAEIEAMPHNRCKRPNSLIP
jgi:hypothetical protein